MARKIRFRRQRIYKLKIAMVFVLFISVLLFGLATVDINKSYMLYGEPRLELVRVELLEQDIYRVSILNSGFSVNLKYIKRDIYNLKAHLNIKN